jgi:hypothetical protein
MLSTGPSMLRSLAVRGAAGDKPGVENMLESCADTFGRERLGHACRPPGRIDDGSIVKRGSHASAPPDDGAGVD